MKLGIIGAGQLARMLALAAYPLNIKCMFLDPNEKSCAASLGELLISNYDDQASIAKIAKECDFVTYEFENVSAQALESLANLGAVAPSPRALTVSSDRLLEKSLFKQLGIKTAAYSQVDSIADLEAAVDQIGYPGILKSRHSGYDGKGQVVIRDRNDLVKAWSEIDKVSAIFEKMVDFSREVSMIAVRSRRGEIRYYSLVENVHENGVLKLSTVRLNDDMQTQAESFVQTLLEELDYVGVIALEMFQVGNELVVNEFAPRVHNSGHWTIEGAITSQFENHVRAVTNLPIGDCSAVSPSAMVNLVGKLPAIEEILKVDGANIHYYDKEPRAGRKVGHVTICAEDNNALKSRLDSVLQVVNS